MRPSATASASASAWLLLPLIIYPSLLQVSALEIPVRRVSRRAAPFFRAAATSVGGDEDVSTDDNLIYIANITIGGTEVPVQLDTGSSDLWVKPTSSLSSTNPSTIMLNLTYGIGYASGIVNQASVSFAGYTLPSQAFVYASAAQNPVFSYGAQGIVGLGFTDLSQIDMAVNETDGAWGRSLLFNAFAQQPADPNFISFALERSDDPSDATEGSFSIGEYNPKYTAIQDTAAMPTVPAVNPRRWTISLDALEVPGQNITSFSSVVSGAPSGKAVVLLDSGTSYAYVSTQVAQAMYGNVPGAQYIAQTQTWTLPCDAQVQAAFWFGGQRFPIHPLDSNRQVDSNDCMGTFLPQSMSVGGSDYDFLLGDVFLRNAYSLYDFGDTDSSGKPTTGPYVKLLSITDQAAALADFVAVRGGSVPNSVQNDNSSSTAPGTASATALPGVPAPTSSSVVTTDDTVVLASVEKLLSYAPALFALLACNALLLFCLFAVGLWYVLRRSRRGQKGAKPRSGGKPAYQPVELQSGTRDSVFNPEAPYSQDDLQSDKRQSILEPPISPAKMEQQRMSMRASTIDTTRGSRLVRASYLPVHLPTVSVDGRKSLEQVDLNTEKPPSFTGLPAPSPSVARFSVYATPRGSVYEPNPTPPRGSLYATEPAARGAPSPRGSVFEKAHTPRGSVNEAVRTPRGSVYETAPAPRGSVYETAPAPRGSVYETAPAPRGSIYETAPTPRGSFYAPAPAPAQTTRTEEDLAAVFHDTKEDTASSHSSDPAEELVNVFNPKADEQA